VLVDLSIRQEQFFGQIRAALNHLRSLNQLLPQREALSYAEVLEERDLVDFLVVFDFILPFVERKELGLLVDKMGNSL